MSTNTHIIKICIDAGHGGKDPGAVYGDWLEKEASSEIKPGESEVVMLRTPVMSAIVKNSAISADFTGSDAENDAKLSAIVSFIDENYLDGNGTPSDADATTLGVARSTLDFIYHARRVRHALVDFVAVVPEFSAELEEAMLAWEEAEALLQEIE